MPTFWRVFYHKRVLNFVESFFCNYWDDHMVFILQFVNMVYHIAWFAYIEESLNSWDKPHLIVVYDPFNVLLDSCPVVFFFCDIFVWFCYQGDGGLVEWVWECSSLCCILEEFENDRCQFFCKYLIEYTCLAIWSWAFVCWKIFIHSFNFSACDPSVYIFYFFLVQCQKVVQNSFKFLRNGCMFQGQF